MRPGKTGSGCAYHRGAKICDPGRPGRDARFIVVLKYATREDRGGMRVTIVELRYATREGRVAGFGHVRFERGSGCRCIFGRSAPANVQAETAKSKTCKDRREVAAGMSLRSLRANCIRSNAMDHELSKPQVARRLSLRALREITIKKFHAETAKGKSRKDRRDSRFQMSWREMGRLES